MSPDCKSEYLTELMPSNAPRLEKHISIVKPISLSEGQEEIIITEYQKLRDEIIID